MKKLITHFYYSWEYHYAHYAFQGRRMLTEIYALDSTPIALTGNEDAVEIPKQTERNQ
jgi:hydroxymethylglutaryl-CoA synthase